MFAKMTGVTLGLAVSGAGSSWDWRFRVQATRGRAKRFGGPPAWLLHAGACSLQPLGSWLMVMVYGLWFSVYGLWFMVYGLRFMVYGLWFMVYGLVLSVQG